jgi:hypothetical protein
LVGCGPVVEAIRCVDSNAEYIGLSLVRADIRETGRAVAICRPASGNVRARRQNLAGVKRGNGKEHKTKNGCAEGRFWRDKIFAYIRMENPENSL